jgi:hypothetical protein
MTDEDRLGGKTTKKYLPKIATGDLAEGPT